MAKLHIINETGKEISFFCLFCLHGFPRATVARSCEAGFGRTSQPPGTQAVAKRAILHHKTARFKMPYGPFGIVKRHIRHSRGHVSPFRHRPAMVSARRRYRLRGTEWRHANRPPLRKKPHSAMASLRRHGRMGVKRQAVSCGSTDCRRQAGIGQNVMRNMKRTPCLWAVGRSR